MSVILNTFKSPVTIQNSVENRKERGRRIEYTRLILAGCRTRQEFCKGCLDISTGTLKNWENGYLNGLTLKGAIKIAERAKEYNIYCSPTWLMYGIGHEPTRTTPGFIEPDEKYFQQVASEMLLFCQQDHSTEANVIDDAMAPKFYPGDLVAGIVVNNIEEAINRECIVLDIDNNKYVRLLSYGDESGKFNLVSLNKNSETSDLKNIQIKTVAPIIWIRKPNPKS
jgi:hypothetical protein